jgi:HEAT repeat protein
MIWWKYQQLRLGSLKTRLAVVEKLAETFDEKAVSLLILALDDKNSEPSRWCVTTTGARWFR